MEATTQTYSVPKIDYMLLCADVERHIKTPSKPESTEEPPAEQDDFEAKMRKLEELEKLEELKKQTPKLTAPKENIGEKISRMLMDTLDAKGILTDNSDLRTLYGEDLTGENLMHQLKLAVQYANSPEHRNAVMLIVYDSHGVIGKASGEPMFATRGGSMAASLFWQILAGIPETVNLLVILDACFSGALGSGVSRGACITSARPGESVGYVSNINPDNPLDSPTSSLSAALASLVKETKPSDLTSLSLNAVFGKLSDVFRNEMLKDLRLHHKRRNAVDDKYVCPEDVHLLKWRDQELQHWKVPEISMFANKGVDLDKVLLFQPLAL